MSHLVFRIQGSGLEITQTIEGWDLGTRAISVGVWDLERCLGLGSWTWKKTQRQRTQVVIVNAEPLASGTHKTVMARFWLWLQIKCDIYFDLFPLRSAANLKED